MKQILVASTKIQLNEDDFLQNFSATTHHVSDADSFFRILSVVSFCYVVIDLSLFNIISLAEFRALQKTLSTHRSQIYYISDLRNRSALSATSLLATEHLHYTPISSREIASIIMRYSGHHVFGKQSSSAEKK